MATTSTEPAPRYDALRKKLEGLLQKGDAYSAQQMYKTIANRYIKRGNYKEAVELYAEGVAAVTQLSAEESGLELAVDSLDALRKWGGDTPESEHTNYIVAMQRHLGTRVEFLQEAIKWLEGCEEVPFGILDSLKLLLARKHEANGDYYAAATVFTTTGQHAEYLDMLWKWSEEGDPAERDLVIARAVLHYLVADRYSSAQALLVQWKFRVRGEPDEVKKPLLESPLVRFLGLLLEAIEYKSTELFELLKRSYGPSLQRDVSFEAMVEAIGRVQFNIQPEVSPMASMMQQFMQGMMS